MPPRMALALTTALQELATNSVKYDVVSNGRSSAKNRRRNIAPVRVTNCLKSWPNKCPPIAKLRTFGY
jgi:two-component sensor histidine kinase